MGFGNFTAGLAEKLELLRTALDKKVDKVDGMGLSESNYTKLEKDKLAEIEDNANNYEHPTAPGSKHIPAGGSEGQILIYSSDGTAQWGEDKDTTYDNATANQSGLMSGDDKAKLDGIEAGAQVNPMVTDAGKIGSLSTLKAIVGTIVSSEKGKVNHMVSYFIDNDLADVAFSGSYNDLSDTPENAAATKAGFLSSTDKSKLDGIEAGANNYIHPLNHEASMITQDSIHRFVTDAEKNTWNNKLSATATIDGGTF